jgi:predicted RNA binding protein YcfA (HicA-like mRNA interferase family)
MGWLAGFRYREITKHLKALGFTFDRQAAGSHEIW